MIHKLPNGVTVEGDINQVNTARKAFGFEPLYQADGVHYKSASRGVVRISEMDDNHIKNAIRKMHSANIAALDTSKSNQEFLDALGAPDITLLGLIAELQRRVRTGGKFNSVTSKYGKL